MGQSITCSVKASWVTGMIVDDEICQAHTNMSHYKLQATLNVDDAFSAFEWSNDGGEPKLQDNPKWTSVSLTNDWLNTLTPAVTSNATSYTTLASTLETITERTFPFQDQQSISMAMNTIIATFVADGMSRVGLIENDFLGPDSAPSVCYKNNPTPCTWYATSGTRRSLFKDLLNQKLKFAPNATFSQQPGKYFKFQFTVAGYGIKATSTPYYLALTVLFVYMAIALAHVVWTAWPGRKISSTWTSLTDVLALSQTSPAPTDGLENTSTGVKSHKTLKMQVRIRNNPAVASGRETLQLLFGKDGEDGALEVIRENMEYGAKS